MSGSYGGRWREARKMASSQTVPRPLSTFDPSQARLDTCETKMAVRNARSQSFLTSYRKNTQRTVNSITCKLPRFFSCCLFSSYSVSCLVMTTTKLLALFLENNCHSILFPEQSQAIEPMRCKDKCQTIK